MTKININHKLFFLIKIFIIYIMLFLKSYAEDVGIEKNMIVIGSDNAQVKIKVFSSLTCPHCANFHMTVVPKIKKEYIESGKAQLIFVDFPLDEAAFNASKLLHCVDQNKQIAFLDTIYETQNKWTNGTDINEINKNLKKIVENLGISSENFDKCLLDETISDKILNGRIEASQKYSINSTPTILIIEKKLEGYANYKNIKKKNREDYLTYEI